MSFELVKIDHTNWDSYQHFWLSNGVIEDQYHYSILRHEYEKR